MTDNPSQPFLDMAARISRNPSSEFGGAMIVVPPGNGPVLDFLFITIDPTDEEAFFWAQCESKLKVKAMERMQDLSNPNPFGQRR